ncbi:hypothetical protein [Escherichia phage phiWec190]|nr:hypothetical protein [Escherichia phage phiWec188]BDU13811.1 hypothetical protein [Escherichia phage phiWec190]
MSEFFTVVFLGIYLVINAVGLIMSLIENMGIKWACTFGIALMLSPVWIYICKAVQLIS